MPKIGGGHANWRMENFQTEQNCSLKKQKKDIYKKDIDNNKHFWNFE